MLTMDFFRGATINLQSSNKYHLYYLFMNYQNYQLYSSYFPNPILYYFYAPSSIQQNEISASWINPSYLHENGNYNFQTSEKIFGQKLEIEFEKKSKPQQNLKVDEKNSENKVKHQNQKLQIKDKSQNLENISLQKYIKPQSIYQNQQNSEQLKKKNEKQSPFRNVINNVCNKLLTFVCNKKRSSYLLIKMRPHWTRQKIAQFYKYANTIKPRPGSYVNFLILIHAWSKNRNHCQFDKIFRIIAYYYLSEICSLSVMNSKRIKNEYKIYHLKAKRKIMQKLVFYE